MYAGTTAVDGALTIDVTAVPENGRLARIEQMVQRALARPSRIAQIPEHIREVGIRLFVSARGTGVLGQFLVEAVLLSLAGGALGGGLSVAVCEVLIPSSVANFEYGGASVTFQPIWATCMCREWLQ